MNPKFLELAIEANLYVDFNGQPWPRNMNGTDIEGAYQRFAELIVRDCMYNLYINGYDDAMNQIQQHYGVK
jgi:hypothetical protein